MPSAPRSPDYVTRLQLASDATQSAIADVNSMRGKVAHGKNFTRPSPPEAQPAPMPHGARKSSPTGTSIISARLTRIFPPSRNTITINTVFSPEPGKFRLRIFTLMTDLQSTMSPEPAFPVSISEFNVYDGSEFNGLTTTLDTPLNYSAFGSIAVKFDQKTPLMNCTVSNSARRSAQAIRPKTARNTRGQTPTSHTTSAASPGVKYGV